MSTSSLGLGAAPTPSLGSPLIDGAATTERLKGVFGGRRGAEAAVPWTPAPGSPTPTTPAGEDG